jgi:anti-sigma factor RsiW
MQTRNSNTRSDGAVSHPNSHEWMDFLYRELPPKRQRELGAHLAQCSECAAQVKEWRVGMTVLDEWTLPAAQRASRQWQPVIKWAAAAAIVLFVGFTFGRQTSSAEKEIAALKATVAQLAQNMENERILNARNAALEATEVTSQILSEHAQIEKSIQAEDREATALALRSIEARLSRLRSELETVALNTRTGFEQTHEGLTRLALAANAESQNSVQ